MRDAARNSFRGERILRSVARGPSARMKALFYEPERTWSSELIQAAQAAGGDSPYFGGSYLPSAKWLPSI